MATGLLAWFIGAGKPLRVRHNGAGAAINTSDTGVDVIAPGEIARRLAKSGEGFYHLALVADDVAATGIMIEGIEEWKGDSW
jgi:hypothetical protein